jgi:hypothetical protein
MAKLTTKARKALPSKSFAGPDRSFPIQDKVHAQKALQLVGRSQSAGNITPMQAAMIKSKARAKLGKKVRGSKI